MDSVLKYAKSIGYKKILHRTEWEGMSVYELVLENANVFVGIPQFIFVKENKFRLASVEEAYKILDFIEGNDAN